MGMQPEQSHESLCLEGLNDIGLIYSAVTVLKFLIIVKLEILHFGFALGPANLSSLSCLRTPRPYHQHKFEH